MNSFEEYPHANKCYCQISEQLLVKWVTERYINKRDTVDLLNSVSDKENRDAISAIALIDADDEVLLEAMSNVNLSEEHILHCREEAKKVVKRMIASAT